MMERLTMDSELTGLAIDTGYGGTEAQNGTGGDAEAVENRREQGYGSGSGVGA